MGAPTWSLAERTYFVDELLPVSKYAGGTYSSPEGLDWAECATIMQDEMDRRGLSRRKYNGEMLFQHYYQKVCTRAYMRGEGDKEVIPTVAKRGSRNMNPPAPPTPKSRPAQKKASKNNIYASTSTQTQVTIEAGSEPERALTQSPQHTGPLATRFDPLVPVTSSSKKRKNQANVEDSDNDDDAEELAFDQEMFVAGGGPFGGKTKATLAQASGGLGEGASRAGDESQLSNKYELSSHSYSEPERMRPAKLKNPWAEPPVVYSPFLARNPDRLDSPISETHSANTSSIAYKMYTPSPSIDPPSSAFNESRLSGHRRTVTESHPEEGLRPSSQASNRSASSSGARYREQSPENGFTTRSPRRETRNAAWSEHSQGPRFSRPSRNEPPEHSAFRVEWQSPITPSIYASRQRAPPQMSKLNVVDDGYPANRPASPFVSGADWASRDEQLRKFEENLRRTESRSSGPRNGSTKISFEVKRPTTPDRVSLPGFHIRKRSKLQNSTTTESQEHISLPTETNEQVKSKASTSDGADTNGLELL